MAAGHDHAKDVLWGWVLFLVFLVLFAGTVGVAFIYNAVLG
jgi:hypothetical protein